jgi:hypothetical protein
VHSVGIIEKHLPFSGTNNAILFFRHALSLDERRVKFRPFFYSGGKAKNDGKVHIFEAEENSKFAETNFKEVFFAGAHCGMLRSIRVQ